MAHIAMRPVTTQKVTSSGSSAQSSAFGSNIEYVRVVPDADCHIEFGVNPTAANTKIFLEVRGKKHPATICSLPFYKKSYVKGVI